MKWIKCEECEFYPDCDCSEDREGCSIEDNKEKLTMSGKKAIICTIIFAVLAIVVWVLAHLVPPSPSGLLLGEFLTYLLGGGFLGILTEKFYRWLIKEDK